MSEKAPYVLDPQDQSKGRPATFIFLHGYADDAEGIPLGLAQQFHWYNKLPHLRWVLPNAPVHADTRERAWYMPRALPNASKPVVPGHEDEDKDKEVGDKVADETSPDDEEGILKTCGVVDELIEKEIERGVEPGRIVIGGFSQGCAVSLVWGLTSKLRHKIGGAFCASGYFPLATRIGRIRASHGESAEPNKDDEQMKWLYIHGSKDILVPKRLFDQGTAELLKWVKHDKVETRLYEGMGHSTCNKELRDLLLWLEGIVPA